MNEMLRTVLDDAGGICLPIEYQQSLGIKPGDEIIMRLDDGGIHIIPLNTSVQKAREIVRKYVSPGKRLVDALIQDRKRESERE